MMEIETNAKKPNPTKQHPNNSRQVDRSLAAYKAWICGTYKALMAQAGVPVEEDDITEQEWVGSWKNFWNKGDGETGRE